MSDFSAASLSISFSALSNDKFKYPTNDKNSDPGLI